MSKLPFSRDMKEKVECYHLCVIEALQPDEEPVRLLHGAEGAGRV